MDPLESRVRDYLQGPAYKPLKFAQLAKKLGIRHDNLEALDEILHRLEARRPNDAPTVAGYDYTSNEKVDITVPYDQL